MVSSEVGSKAVEEARKLLALIWEIARGPKAVVDEKKEVQAKVSHEQGPKVQRLVSWIGVSKMLRGSPSSWDVAWTVSSLVEVHGVYEM